MFRALRFFTLFACFAPLTWPQTTQGLISGRLLDARTGLAIESATVTYSSLATNAHGSARIGAGGAYVFPLLSPGLYHIHVEAGDYQAQDIFELELPVAAQLRLDLYLR